MVFLGKFAGIRVNPCREQSTIAPSLAHLHDSGQELAHTNCPKRATQVKITLIFCILTIFLFSHCRKFMVFIHIFLRQNSLDEKNTHRLLYGMTEPIKLRVRLKWRRASQQLPLWKSAWCVLSSNWVTVVVVEQRPILSNNSSQKAHFLEIFSFSSRNERFFPWKCFLAFLFYEPLKTMRKHLDGLQKNPSITVELRKCLEKVNFVLLKWRKISRYNIKKLLRFELKFFS